MFTMAGAIFTILSSMTPSQVVFSTLLLFFSSLIVEHVVSKPRMPKLPTVGHGDGLVGSVKNLLSFGSGFREWLVEGHNKYTLKGKSFKAPRTLNTSPTIVIPKSQIKWLMDLPESVLGVYHSHETFLYLGINCLDPVFSNENFSERVMHKNLPRSLVKMIPSLQEEVVFAIEKTLGTDPTDWRKVNVWDMWMEIVPIVIGRILVGASVNRDPEYTGSMVKYANGLVRNTIILSLCPRPLRKALGWVLTRDLNRYWKILANKVIPIMEERQRAVLCRDSGDPEYADYVLPDDFLSWTIEQAREEGNTAYCNLVLLSKTLLPLHFAAMHTTIITSFNATTDLFSSDPERGYVTGIKEECARVIAEQDGGMWTKPGLGKLVRMDSMIRESQRFSSISVMLSDRLVVAPEGLTNPVEGWHAPQGTMLAMGFYAVHHDKNTYEDADQFDAFRFSRPREEALLRQEMRGEGDDKTNDIMEFARMSMVSMSPQHFPFGYGRHACPGRFLVAYQLKMAFAHIMLNYDILPIKPKPQRQFFGQNGIPATDTMCKLRRRLEPFKVY